MKLLSKQEAHSGIKKRNELLLEDSLRLQRVHKGMTAKFNLAKSDYEPEKVKALEDFEKFCADIDQKKAKKLEELAAVDREIDKKKEIYFGFVEKQDAIEERLADVIEREKKVELRERFITDLEHKTWNTTATSQ